MLSVPHKNEDMFAGVLSMADEGTKMMKFFHLSADYDKNFESGMHYAHHVSVTCYCS